MDAALIAVVTGSSAGLGLEIVREFASKGILPILTGRNVQDKDIEVADKLCKEGLQVIFHQLDVTSIESVNAFAAWLKGTFGRLDILVNNAGVLVGPVMETNYYGAKRVVQAMIPLMRHRGARIINMGSVAGRLDLLCHREWAHELEHIDDEETIDKFANEYLEKGLGMEEGKRWTLQVPRLEPYTVSKMCLAAYSRTSAKELRDIFVCCCCTGLTNTGMTGVGHPLKIGIQTPIWLATAPSSELKSGGFYVNMREVGFVNIPFFFEGKTIPELLKYIEFMYKFFGN